MVDNPETTDAVLEYWKKATVPVISDKGSPSPITIQQLYDILHNMRREEILKNIEHDRITNHSAR